ncbi:cag pathogenicity island protein Cag11 [Roseovarius spongiae]|uniref:Cag pathogenicity island protein Cag11 n=1 Tax=Roseovarius spongiae TaxID=2320272 RepID=A0A3A8AY09_9RHOB|nr:CoA transferase [Roseovarius spongiae]RKF16797.1 cag pathogenicity island protein Cag11 [Roseovarius spongiae]
MSGGVLQGVRVLDLTRMLSGPYCTMMLADHGAEVIKIEGPNGDTSRGNGPWRDDDPGRDWAGYFVSLKRGKKSVMLDLKTDEGKAALRALVATADVLVENFRPGVMERLGLGYEELAAFNPRLVYAAIRGFGDPRSGRSPYADWPSYDVVAQAMGGIMSLTGPDADTPTKVGPGIGDIFAGMMMAFAVVTALRHAEAAGEGQFIDLGMYDAMVSLCERAIYLHDMTGNTPGPEGNGHPFLAPFGTFPASDGAIALGIVDDAFWRVLAEIIGHDGLADDPRFATRAARAAHRDEVNRIVADWSRGFTKAELTELLGGKLPFGPLNSIADIMADPHIAARDMLANIPHPDPERPGWTVAANPLRFSHTPAPELRTPPALGQDTDRYLSEMPQVPMSDPQKRALRDTLGAFATGVTVITTRQADGAPRGFTANSFTSVSLDPPMVLVCIGKTAHSCEVFKTAPHFAVNVLSEEQKQVSGLFASRDPDKFARCDWQSGTADMPLIRGALAEIVCERARLIDAGDHVILLGQVIDFSAYEGRPLGYFRGAYVSARPEDDLVSAMSELNRIEIGAVLARGRQVLFRIREDGSASVPFAPHPHPSLPGLETHLAKLSVNARLGFLYGVYQDSKTNKHVIYYRGTAEGYAPAGYRFFDIDDMPLDDVPDSAERSMLRRYCEEFRLGAFGIYQGDETTGTVHRVAAPGRS